MNIWYRQHKSENDSGISTGAIWTASRDAHPPVSGWLRTGSGCRWEIPLHIWDRFDLPGAFAGEFFEGIFDFSVIKTVFENMSGIADGFKSFYKLLKALEMRFLEIFLARTVEKIILEKSWRIYLINEFMSFWRAKAL